MPLRTTHLTYRAVPRAPRYHKYTGMPVWARDSPMVAAMVPSPDGKSLMTTGWSYASWGEARP